MLLDERWFENGSTYDTMFSKLLVQNDSARPEDSAAFEKIKLLFQRM